MLGGGIRSINASPTISNCTLLRNNAGKFGGGIYTTNGSPIITNCAFIENTAEDGGGIYTITGSPTIVNCTFSGNTVNSDSYSGGGGLYMVNGSPTITNCTFSGNKALGQDSRGGAIYNRSSALITNCVFYGNHSDMLGGMFCNEADTPTLINCTSSGNSAISCGGIVIWDGSLTITNSILWGDTDKYRNNEIGNFYGTPPSVSYCDISQDGYAGSNGNIQLDPLFIDPANGNFRLLRGSPCIDAANSDGASITDREGNERYDDPITPNTGTGPFTFYDMGAYEFQGDIDGDGVHDDGDRSGLIGDNPCAGGEIENCDDSCPTTSNPLQEDTFPPQGNGIGDACDCEANFDCDQDVDAEDVTAFLTDFGRSQYYNPCEQENPCHGDFSCDGDVDADDVTKFLEDFGRSQYNNPCPVCIVGEWCSY